MSCTLCTRRCSQCFNPHSHPMREAQFLSSFYSYSTERLSHLPDATILTTSATGEDAALWTPGLASSGLGAQSGPGGQACSPGHMTWLPICSTPAPALQPWEWGGGGGGFHSVQSLPTQGPSVPRAVGIVVPQALSAPLAPPRMQGLPIRAPWLDSF